MKQPTSSRNQILIVLIVALAVFTIGILGITLGLRTLGQRVEPSPTVDISSLPLTPLPQPTATNAAMTTVITEATTATETPTVTQTPSSTVTPSPTSTPTSTLVPTETAVPTPTPYAGPLRENGGDYTSPRTESIIIDGVLLEWRDVPSFPLPFIQQGEENYDGPDDLTVSTRLTWDEKFLYVAAEVIDDVHVQALSGYDLFNGDGVELWIDIDLAGDFKDDSRNGDDFQFGFSPGNFDSIPSEGVVWYSQRNPEWNARLQVVAQPQDNGYTLEAAIPWSMLEINPRTGMILGYAVNANDNDVPDTSAQQTILMHTAVMAWGRPTTFSNLRLQ